jgi:PhnB protein
MKNELMSSTKNTNSMRDIKTSIAPWLSVKNSIAAVDFIKLAFDAVELYRLDIPGEVVAQLSIDGAEFWVSEESSESLEPASASVSVRMILTVADPDRLFTQGARSGSQYSFSDRGGARLENRQVERSIWASLGNRVSTKRFIALRLPVDKVTARIMLEFPVK